MRKGPAAAARAWWPWWRELSVATLRADAGAALLAAVLVLPQAMAFAALAGLPLEWGLYSAVIPTAVAALAGSSRHMLTGPTNALALALAASLAPLAAVGSAEYGRLALVLMLGVGLIQLAVALLRLGVLTHFISPAVLLGFTSGAALLIAWHALKNLGLWPLLQPVALAEGLATLALALALQRWRPRWPVLLLALVAGTLLSVALHRLADVDVARVGALPQAWPQWQVPVLGWADVPALASQALALTLIALGQTVAVAKVLAQRSGQPLDVNRECLGQGLANVAGSFFSCFVVCGSFNRSVPHLAAGARTPLAAVLAAGLLLLLVAVAAPALAWVPLTAISALLLLVAWGLVDRAAWRELWRLDRRDAAVAGGTFAAVLLLPLHVAVLAGVAASLVVYLHRTAHPALRSMGFASPPPVLDASGAAAAAVEAAAPATPVVAAPTLRPFVVLAPGAPECPQLKLLRMEGSVWFGAAPHVSDALQALHDAPEGPRHLLVMAKSMNFIDSAGAALWEQERVRRRAAGGDLYFHRPRPEVLRIWEAGGFVQRLGHDHLFADKRSAIAAIVPRLDGAVCARCRHRVFEECARQPGPDAPLR